jgi:hypothetical protein
MNFNEKINILNWSEPTPNLSTFRKAGYGVEIVHNRRFKVAYVEPITGKLIIKAIYNDTHSMTDKGLNTEWKYPKKPALDTFCMSELLAKGGITEITVTDPGTKTDFYAKSICRDDENYNRAAGVEKCLSRVYDLMTVCNDVDGFKMKL